MLNVCAPTKFSVMSILSTPYVTILRLSKNPSRLAIHPATSGRTLLGILNMFKRTLAQADYCTAASSAKSLTVLQSVPMTGSRCMSRVRFDAFILRNSLDRQVISPNVTGSAHMFSSSPSTSISQCSLSPMKLHWISIESPNVKPIQSAELRFRSSSTKSLSISLP
jgi:hypothetical protein